LKLSKSSLATNGTVTVTLDVKNTGSRAGAEVVQLYLHDPDPKIDKPVRELKGFQRVELLPGQTKRVSFELSPRALAYCDVAGKEWKADAGAYEVQVGASSRDIRLQKSLRLAETYTRPIPFLEEQKPLTPAPDDLAAFRPTTSSSADADTEYGSQAAKATDGNNSTYWRSQNSDAQWLAVDLGGVKSIGRVRLTWATDRFAPSYAKAYAIQVSPNGQSWTDVFNTMNGQGGIETDQFPRTSARWVRLLCTKRAANEDYKLVSFEVFAPAN
jgi:beta-glucosidase